MKKVNKFLLSGLALFTLPSSTLSNNNIKQNFNNEKGYFGQKEDTSDSQAKQQPDIKDKAESSQLEYDYYKNNASSYVKANKLGWQDLYANYVWEKIYQGLLEKSSFEKAVINFKNQIKGKESTTSSVTNEINLINSIKSQLLKKVINKESEDYKNALKVGERILEDPYFKNLYDKRAEIYDDNIKTSFAEYKKWLDKAENKKYALEFFKESKYTDIAIKSFNARVKKAKGKLGTNLTKEEWFQEIDKFAKKTKITTLSRTGNHNREQWKEIYVRDYFATYIRYGKKNAIYAKDQYVFWLWFQLYKLINPEHNIDSGTVAKGVGSVNAIKQQVIASFANDSDKNDSSIKKTLLKNNLDDIRKYAKVSESKKKELAFEKWYKDNSNDDQLLFELSRDMYRLSKKGNKYSQAWTWRGSEEWVIYQNLASKDYTYANKLKYFRQWKKTVDGKRQLKEIFYTKPGDFEINNFGFIYYRGYEPKLKISEALKAKLEPSKIYDDFINTDNGQYFYNAELFKIILNNIKEDEYFDTSYENDEFKINKPLANSQKDYASWIDKPENKKYSLEFFKKSKYTNKAIASFNVRVKKANGKLGAILTKDEWYEEIDKFATKDKVTTLSRTGDHNREEWKEIYVRDYFATYIKNVKKKATFSKDQYAFYLYKKIYENLYTKIISGREKLQKEINNYNAIWNAYHPAPSSSGWTKEELEKTAYYYGLIKHLRTKIFDIYLPNAKIGEFSDFEVPNVSNTNFLDYVDHFSNQKYNWLNHIIKTYDKGKEGFLPTQKYSEEEKNNLLLNWYANSIDQVFDAFSYFTATIHEEETLKDLFEPEFKTKTKELYKKWLASTQYKEFKKFETTNLVSDDYDYDLIRLKKKKYFHQFVKSLSLKDVENKESKFKIYLDLYEIVSSGKKFASYAQRFYNIVATIKSQDHKYQGIIDQWRFSKLNEFFDNFLIDNVKFSKADFANWFDQEKNAATKKEIYENDSRYKQYAQDEVWNNIKKDWNAVKSKEAFDKNIYNYNSWDKDDNKKGQLEDLIKNGYDKFKEYHTRWYDPQFWSWTWGQVYSAIMKTPFDSAVSRFKFTNHIKKYIPQLQKHYLEPSSAAYKVALVNNAIEGAKKTLIKDSDKDDTKTNKELFKKYPEEGNLTLKEKRALVEQKYHDMVWVYRKLEIEKNWKNFLKEDSWLKGKYEEAKFEKFTKSEKIKVLRNIEAVKEIVPKVKTLSTFYIDRWRDLAFDKDMEIDISRESYLKWFKEKENKKYALEIFKKSKYTDIAIASFNARVKKAKGKLGADLNKEEYFKKIDEFAKKTKVTTLSRTGNHNRDEWIDIYIRDYFATYTSKVKRSTTFARELYNFFAWNKIYDLMSLEDNGISTVRKKIKKAETVFKNKYFARNPEAKKMSIFELRQTSFYYESWMNTIKYMQKFLYPSADFDLFMKPLVPIGMTTKNPKWTEAAVKGGADYLRIRGLDALKWYTGQPYYEKKHNWKSFNPSEETLKPYLLNWGVTNLEKMTDIIYSEKKAPEIYKKWKKTEYYKEAAHETSLWKIVKHSDGKNYLSPPSEADKKLIRAKYLAKWLESDYASYNQYRDFFKKVYKKMNNGKELYDELKRRYFNVHVFRNEPKDDQYGMFQWHEMHFVKDGVEDVVANVKINNDPINSSNKLKNDKWVMTGLYANYSSYAKTRFKKWQELDTNKWLQKETSLLRLDEYKQAIKKWIDSKVGVSILYPNIDEFVDHYVDEIKTLEDLKAYRVNPNEAKDFKEWLSDSKIVSILKENVYTKDGNKIWDGWKTSTKYQDALTEANNQGASQGSEKYNQILLKHFKVWGDLDNENSAKYQAALKVFKTSNLVYGDDKKEILPLTRGVHHYSQSKFSQQEVFWMEWVDKQIRDDEKVKRLFSELYNLKKYSEYKKIKFTSYNQFWTRAWDEWTKTKEAKDMFLKKIRAEGK